MQQTIINIKRLLVFFLIMSFNALWVVGSESKEEDALHHSDNPQHADAEEQHAHHDTDEGFNPKEFIFSHVGDAHSWHLLTINGHHISVPLPVILYSKHSGLHLFMSSKFHHGHNAYRNFELGLEKPYKGKVIEKLPGGDIYLPLDFSITKNVVAALFSLLFMLWLFITVANRYKRNPLKAPKGKQSFIEPIILFVRDDIAKPIIGEHKYEKFLPYLLTLFFFIWFNNMLGLIPIPPGGTNLTGNIAVTGSLALFTFVMTNIHGNKHYWKDIFNTPGVPAWLKVPVPVMPLIELIGIFVKPFTLMVRLFANITAGHIIVLSFFGLIFIMGEMSPVAGYSSPILVIPFTVFMTFLELLVALIQAYVFTLLSTIYLGMATAEHH